MILKYLITGGGTGGHINPALAIANEIKRIHPDADILYIGTKDGMEADLVPRAGFKFKTIRVKWLPRKFGKKTFIAVRELAHGFMEARRILKEFKPDVVVGTGGYVSFPVVYLARKMKIPALIHEQNAFPGITNKVLGRYVNTVAITFDDAKKYFKHPERIVKTGNPIRKEILDVKKVYAYDKLNIDPNRPFVLSFGGSSGQWKLNKKIHDVLKEYKEEDNMQIIHVTGKKMYDEFMERLKEENVVLHEDIRILPFLYEVPEALTIADLVITSAGAITLAEIAAIGVPAILIPKAYTAENHQEYNARSFEQKGAAEVLLEKDLTGESLKDILYSTIKDKEKLKSMSVNSKKMGNIEATSFIVKEVDNLIGNK